MAKKDGSKTLPPTTFVCHPLSSQSRIESGPSFLQTGCYEGIDKTNAGFDNCWGHAGNDSYARSRPMTNGDFLGSLFTSTLFGLFRWVAVMYIISFLIINVTMYMNFYFESREMINDAHERYSRVCEAGRHEAQYFYSTCVADKKTIQKYPSIEALERLARKFQICGETGCGNVSYTIGGAIFGIFLFIWIVPKFRKLWNNYISTADDESTSNMMYNKEN